MSKSERGGVIALAIVAVALIAGAFLLRSRSGGRDRYEDVPIVVSTLVSDSVEQPESSKEVDESSNVVSANRKGTKKRKSKSGEPQHESREKAREKRDRHKNGQERSARDYLSDTIRTKPRKPVGPQ